MDEVNGKLILSKYLNNPCSCCSYKEFKKRQMRCNKWARYYNIKPSKSWDPEGRFLNIRRDVISYRNYGIIDHCEGWIGNRKIKFITSHLYDIDIIKTAEYLKEYNLDYKMYTGEQAWYGHGTIMLMMMRKQ